MSSITLKVASELILGHKIPLYYYSTTASVPQDIHRLLSPTLPFTTGILLLTPVNGSTQALLNNGIFLPQANSSLLSLIQDLIYSSVGLTSKG